MASDPDAAEKYRTAWARFAWPGFPPANFHTVGPGPLGVLDGGGVDVEADPSTARARSALKESGPNILRDFPGAAGVGLSLRYRPGQLIDPVPTVTIFSRADPAVLKVPDIYLDLPTCVVQGGLPTLHSNGHLPGLRLRPAPPGGSVGHVRITSGTFGCLVRDEDDNQYILSCAHVLSDGLAVPGDDIVQAGSGHGGRAPGDCIATFERAVPLQSGTSVADAAIARVGNSTHVDSIVRYVNSKPQGTRSLSKVGVLVQKSGDQTGLTHGIVVAANATIGPYSVNGVSGIYFTDAIVTTGMAQPGDSGSLLMDYQCNAVGLLFGGLLSPTTTPPAYVADWYNPIDTVLQALGVSLA